MRHAGILIFLMTPPGMREECVVADPCALAAEPCPGVLDLVPCHVESAKEPDPQRRFDQALLRVKRAKRT